VHVCTLGGANWSSQTIVWCHLMCPMHRKAATLWVKVQQDNNLIAGQARQSRHRST